MELLQDMVEVELVDIEHPAMVHHHYKDQVLL